MADLPITQVGRIFSSEFGRPALALAAKGAVAQSVGDLGRVGVAVIHRGGLLAFQCHFDFEQELEPYPQRMLFDGAIVQTLISLGNQSLLGVTVVKMGAQSARPTGVMSERVGIAQVSHLAEPHDFNFDSATQNTSQPYFHFGTTAIPTLLITQAGRITPPTFSAVKDINIAWTLAPKSIDQERIGYPRINSVGVGTFDFEFTPSTPLDFSDGYRHFVFGGDHVVSQVTLGDTHGMGVNFAIKNTADTIRYAGRIASRAKFGYPALYPVREKPSHNIPLNIEFNQDIRKANPLNTPFYFFYDYEVPVQGFDLSLYGTPSIENAEDILLPTGIGGLQVGLALVELGANKAQNIDLSGEDCSLFGVNELYLSSHFIVAGAMRTDRYGVAKVSHRVLIAKPFGIASQQFGLQFVSHEVRDIQMGEGLYSSIVGSPWVSFYRRELLAKAITAPQLPQPIVGPKIIVVVEGFDATLFGERIIPESQQLYPQGFAEEYGLPDVYLSTQYIKLEGFESLGLTPVDQVYNLTQYIEMYYFAESELNPPTWSKWIHVVHGKRTVTTHGTFFQKIGRPVLDLGARVIHLKGIDTSDISAQNMISHYLRWIETTGIEPDALSQWSAIHNAASKLTLAGVESNLVFGQPGLINTRRYFPYIGAFDSLEMGEPMIADRIRSIDIESRYSIEPLTIPLPTVELYTRYIDVIGQEYGAIGAINFAVYKNIITPRWSPRDYYGNPTVHNVTPEISIYGHDSAELGEPEIRLQWRELNTIGDGATLFGQTRIRDRKQKIEVHAFAPWAVGHQVHVEKTESPPFTPQYIYLNNVEIDGEWRDGHGISAPDNQVGKPYVWQNVLYVSSMESMTIFGQTTIHCNNIDVSPGIGLTPITGPTIYLKRVRVYPESIKSLFSFGKPQISPYTIWATFDAPAQAKSNHQSSWNLVDSEAVFGFAKVVNVIFEPLRVAGFTAYSMGQPQVESSINYIRPDGIRASRMGWHEIPSMLREVVQFESNDSMEFGQTRLTNLYKGPYFPKPIGLYATSFGLTHIELLHRELKMKGLDSLAMGNSRGGTLYKPQSLHVGFPMPTIPRGSNMAIFGTLFISNFIRQLDVKGFDAFVSQLDSANFGRRMKVELVDKPKHIFQTKEVFAQANDHAFYGVPDIRLAVHYIRPDGNSDQYRKGDLENTEQRIVTRYIHAPGIDSSRFGYDFVGRQIMAINIEMNRELKPFNDFNF